MVLNWFIWIVSEIMFVIVNDHDKILQLILIGITQCITQGGADCICAWAVGVSATKEVGQGGSSGEARIDHGSNPTGHCKWMDSRGISSCFQFVFLV